MGVSGEAEVLAVSPCPPVEPGVGRVVTGTFRNERNHGLRALHVSVAGEVSCLRVTSGHPVWSVTRGVWIGAGELAAGEALAAWRGEPVAVLANLPEADTATWNLEVENEHVYRVGPAGILVHNTSPTPKELFEGGRGRKECTDPSRGWECAVQFGFEAFGSRTSAPRNLSPSGGHRWRSGSPDEGSLPECNATSCSGFDCRHLNSQPN